MARRKKRTRLDKIKGKSPGEMPLKVTEELRSDRRENSVHEFLTVVADGHPSSVMSDLTLSKAFAKTFGDLVSYVPEIKGWMCFDGSCWIADGGEQIAEAAMKTFIHFMGSMSGKIEDDTERARFVKATAKYYEYRKRHNLLLDSKSEMVRSITEFDSDPHLFNCDNCTLEITDDGKVLERPHSAADLLTKCAPVKYDPTATCEEFESVVAKSMMGDLEMVEYLQKTFALALMGQNLYEKFNVWGETVRCGKGTIMSPMFSLFGLGNTGYSCCAQPETFAVRKFANGSSASGDRARFRGVRLLVSSEPPEGMEFDSSFLKQLSGRDYLTARYNYGEDFNFRFDGQLVVQCNTLPSINDQSVFDSDRVRVVPFKNFIPEAQRDKELKKRLCRPEQLSGTLNWILRGVPLLHESGYDAPEPVVRATEEYRGRFDTVSLYVAERIHPAPDALVPLSTVLDDYTLWCQQTKRTPLGRNTFMRRIKMHVPWVERATVNGEQQRGVMTNHALVSD